MNTGRIRIKVGGTVIACLLGLATGVSGRPITVMITGQNIRTASPYLETYREACAKDGVQVTFVLHPPAVDYTAISLDLMKQFDVIVFHGVPVEMPSCKGNAAQVAAFRDRLDQYHKMGGGILWTPTGFQDAPREWNETIGARYGVKVLPEDLYDPSKQVEANKAIKRKTFSYLWTTDITAHPVTDGVKGLFLPLLGEWSWPGTTPVEFGPDWKVLVRAMESTRTIGNAAVAGTAAQFSTNVSGSIASAPAIVGVREGKEGAGRMMVFPIYSAHTFQNYGHFVFNEAFMQNGADGHPSDGYRLLMNAYRWLAAPAMAAGLGGYQEKPRVRTGLNRSAIDWSALKELPAGSLTGDAHATPRFSGLIGVRSRFGGGAGTVSEYAAAARALGLSFLVFMDDSTQFTADGYQQLVKDCAAASDERFLAVPGYAFEDVWRNTLFLINPKTTPDREFLAEDGRVRDYWGLMMKQMGAGVGLRRLKALPVDPYYFMWITCAAPFTWEIDRLVDDGFDRYRMLQGLGHAYANLAITEVNRPADLAAAAKAVHHVVVQAPTLAQVGEMLQDRASPNVYPMYTSNGPRIERWAVRQAEGDAFRPGGERFRLELSVTNDTDLREVTIVNCQNGQPYRTFRPTGRAFTCRIDESHATQWYLIPVITDVQGRTAVGSMVRTVQAANSLTMMSDRLMGMHHSRLYDAKGQQTVTRGGWLGGITWVKRHNGAGGYPAAGDTTKMRIFGFDGGNVYPGAVDILPQVTTGAGVEPAFPGNRFRNRLASYDLAIMDYDGEFQFDKPDAKDMMVSGLPIPVKAAVISSRAWAVRPRLGTLTAANVHEITVRFKQETTFTRFSVCKLRRWDTGNPCHWFIRDEAGEVDEVVKDGTFKRSGVLRPGDYLYPANEIGGPTGIINLGPLPLQYTADARGAQVFVDGKGQVMQAGQDIQARFICFARDRSVQNEVAWLKAFTRDFGIGVAKPGYPMAVTQGTLQSTTYAIDLAAVNGGATLDVKQYELPQNVPVRVSGLPANAIAGRYDPAHKRLLMLPVFEGMAPTSVDTRRGDTRLYVGELFHCDDPAVILSAVQDGADKLKVEVHNPTGAPRTVRLSAVPGFAPLAGLDKTLVVPPCDSVKLELPIAAGSLANLAYEAE